MWWQAGENNARVQSAAVDALLCLAAVPDAALSSQAPLFLRPEKQTQWKRVLGRYTTVFWSVRKPHGMGGLCGLGWLPGRMGGSPSPHALPERCVGHSLVHVLEEIAQVRWLCFQRMQCGELRASGGGVLRVGL